MAPRHPTGIEEGMLVITVDGDLFGRVVRVDVDEEGLGPESGLFEVLPTGSSDPLSIPFSMARTVQGDRVLLDVTASEARAGIWGPEQRS